MRSSNCVSNCPTGSLPIILRSLVPCDSSTTEVPHSLFVGRCRARWIFRRRMWSAKFLHLFGAHIREREVCATPLRPGIQSIESRRGSSSHQHNPFFALTEFGTDEDHGTAYGFNLVYSGNFLGSAECDADYGCRAQLGINPFDFSWKLEPGSDFQTPEVVLVFSAEGLGGMSRAYHQLYRGHLCRGEWRDKPRPSSSITGKQPISTSTPSSWRKSRPQLQTWASNCSSWTTGGSAIGMTIAPRSATGLSTRGNWRADWRTLPLG